ncbi:MAG TPA: response regulator [Bacteroides sp.]|nr:response regulator [Bacteroides sp.]
MEESPAYQWNSKRILVVEDDESSAFILGDMLKNTGAVIEYSTGGQEAVDFIRSHPDTDLILMDIHLPGMDGFTATRKIKAIAKNVVIIAQTAYAYSVDYQEAARAGCDGFLTKPINPSLLLEKLNSYLA